MKAEANQVLEVAFQLFRQRGLRSCSLHEVARTAGISTKNISALFQGKKELVMAVVDYHLEKYSGYLQVNPVLSPTAVTELSNYFRFIEKLLTELSPPFLFEVRKYHPEVWTKLEEFVSLKLIPYMEKNLLRGLNEQCFREDFDQSLYIQMYFSVLLHIVYDETLSLERTKRLIQQLHNIFQHGILNAKGMRL